MNNFKVLFEIKGANKVHCDNCDTVMGSQYGKMPKDAVSASFRDGEDDYEKNHSYCSKSCAIAHMSGTKKKK